MKGNTYEIFKQKYVIRGKKKYFNIVFSTIFRCGVATNLKKATSGFPELLASISCTVIKMQITRPVLQYLYPSLSILASS